MTAPSIPVWSAVATTRLRDAHSCPVCGDSPLREPACRRCGADLTSPAARALWEASQRAAAALAEREHLRRTVPLTATGRVARASRGTRTLAAPPAQHAPPTSDDVTPGAASGDTPRTHPPSTEGPAASRRRETTVQSVMAVAGAGLFAVAAVVFTFFNPDLSDRVVRSGVTLAATVVLLVGARALAARGLRSSAETVGGLGIVFVGLDVYALMQFAPAAVSPWVFAGIGTLIAGALMAALSVRLRIRAWLGPSVVGLSVAPAMLGIPGGTGSSVAGWLTAMACGMALVHALRRMRPAFGRSLTPEAVALTVAQLVAIVAALAHLALGTHASAVAFLWMTTASAAVVALVARVSSRRFATGLWSFVTGGALASAGLMLAHSLVETFATASPVADTASVAASWYPAAMLVGPAVGFVVATLLLHPVSAASASWTTAGAFLVAGAAALPSAGRAAFGALVTISRSPDAASATDVAAGVGTAVGFGLVALAFAFHGRVQRRRGAPAWTTVLAGWTAGAAAATAITVPHGQWWLHTATGLVIAAGAALVTTRRRGITPAVRLPLLLIAHGALALAGLLSWASTPLAVAAAPSVVAVIALLAVRTPAKVRWAHVGAAYAYALTALAAGTSLTGIGDIGAVSVTTCAAAVVAMLATFVSRISARTWWAILAVTSVPFALGVLQVVRERSGWTALSTMLIFLLALTLTASRRPGLVPALRGVSAAVLVPSLGVVVVCLGAAVLPISASPVTLPVIAALVAVALPATDLVRHALARRGIPSGEASFASGAIEASSLLTGAIAAVLALARDAAGMPTAILVLVVLAAGSAVGALTSRRARLWWCAAAAGTGALWLCWRVAGIDLVEPYLVPPALAAIVVGTALQARGRDARPLVAAGIALGVVPSVVALALTGGSLRLAALLVVGTALAAVATTMRPGTPLSGLRVPVALGAMVAAAAGPVHAARTGLQIGALGAGRVGAPVVPGDAGAFWPALGWAAAGAAVATLAGYALARWSRESAPPAARRWVYAPALAWLLGGVWPSIERDWATIWAMWSLMLAVLTLMLLIAARRRRSDGVLPPVWFLFGLAFTTAVVAWSPRDLRVEWFSLPLGLALLAAGAMHLSRPVDGRPTVGSWPRGAHGSWVLLAPGIIVTLSASIVATFTDPLTWRAILVIVLALIAILIGARARLAAPFVLGVIVLPIENVSAFAVQIGRGIESMPWWITLAVVGAVLLILAVSYERRSGEAEGIAARLRDLR